MGRKPLYVYVFKHTYFAVTVYCNESSQDSHFLFLFGNKFEFHIAIDQWCNHSKTSVEACREKRKKSSKYPKGQSRLTTSPSKTTSKKSPRSREVCFTDHFLAEVKVSNSAPGGPLWHSSLFLIRQQKASITRLLAHTHALTNANRPSFRAVTGHVLD